MEKIHQQLLDPSTYPDMTRTVDFKETHISRIYLTETHVYKIKKPLNLGFLDFTTLEKRQFFCAEEVRLNHRFAPDTYLGVSELRLDHGHLRFDGTGELVDVAVKMRRLPDELMLNQIISRNAEELPHAIDRLANRLWLLLNQAETCRLDDGRSNAEVVAENWLENLTQTEAAIGTALLPEAHRIMSAIVKAQLTQLRPLLAKRDEQSFVRDGHGDLHTGNICMTEPIRIYDCIEFNRRFRVADIAADLAFLLMDLEFMGRKDLACRFLDSYQNQANDKDLEQLLPFYKSYRAWVRGKVESILAGESEVAIALRKEATTVARQYFNLALGYCLPPTLLMTVGRMGVGKTTLATELAGACQAVHLRSDVVRKKLADWPQQTANRDDFNCGLYDPAMSKRTYRKLADQATEILQQSRSVIIDASFSRREDRERFFETAKKTGHQAFILHLECPDESQLTRLERRRESGQDISDGRTELLKQQKEQFDPVDITRCVLTIDSMRPVDYNAQVILIKMLEGFRT